MLPTRTYSAGADLDLTSSLHAVTSVVFQETAGTAPVRVYIRDASASGDVLIPLTAAAGAVVTVSFPFPVVFPNGVYVDQITTSPYTGTMRCNVTGY